MKGKIRQKRGYGWGQVQIGTSSLVLIFTVLALVVFATLSLSSARMDQNLAEKTRQHVVEFYAGDGKAEEKLRDINIHLNQLKEKSLDQTSYVEAIEQGYSQSYDASNNQIHYTIDLNSEQLLLVRLELLPLEEAMGSDKNYRIHGWLVQNKVDYEIDDSIPVWDGTQPVEES